MNNHALARSLGQNRLSAQAVLRFGIVSTVGLLLVLCLFLASRRLSGAFHQPLDSEIMLLVGIGFTALVGCLRTAWPRGSSKRSSVLFWAWLVLPSLAVFLFCFSLALPGSAPWAVALLWFLVVSEEGAWWLAGSPAFRADHPNLPAPNQSLPPADSPDAPSHVDPTSELASDITQQMTRMRDQDGDETVFGQARVEFSSGERSQCIHLAFCPPLAGNPQITVMHAGGPEAAIAVAQAEPFGARFDVRLSSTARQADSVLIEFEARSASASKPREVDS